MNDSYHIFIYPQTNSTLVHQPDMLKRVVCSSGIPSFIPLIWGSVMEV